MLKLRIVKTGSSVQAVQAIRYQNNKRIVIRYFGSCHSEAEVDDLLNVAKEWIKDFSSQLSIFPDEDPNGVLYLNHCEFLGVYYTFFYEVISALQNQIGFSEFKELLFADMVLIRLFEPASKRRSIELLESYFGIKHRRQNYYKVAPKWLTLKEKVETKVVDFANIITGLIMICCFMM